MPQTCANIRARTHQAPDQLAAMVFDHHDHDALVESEIAGRHPGAAIGIPESWIETTRETRIGHHLRIAQMHLARGIENQVRHER